ncbi:hypothetical protein Taro_009547 [Colocasia esculenta]|uniref:Uncharacterized protein n=1 Tax=Colocasia esculenta TaxID=4460 RepID=A0A843U604_COLES|nr:hypothetical protein [Colocasia esculenta]
MVAHWPYSSREVVGRDSLSQEFVAGRLWWWLVPPCVASSSALLLKLSRCSVCRVAPLVERCDTYLWLLSALCWLVVNSGEVLPEAFSIGSGGSECSVSFLSRRVCAEGCFRIVSDSAVSTKVASGPTLGLAVAGVRCRMVVVAVGSDVRCQ